jgi:hypothetical protein
MLTSYGMLLQYMQIARVFFFVGRYYNPANAEMVAPGSYLKIFYRSYQPGTRLNV